MVMWSWVLWEQAQLLLLQAMLAQVLVLDLVAAVRVAAPPAVALRVQQAHLQV